MSLLPHSLVTSKREYDPESFLDSDQAVLSALQAEDESLLTELRLRSRKSEGYFSEEADLRFANAELAGLARSTYDAAQLFELEVHLNERGTLTVPITDGHSVSVDGIERSVSIVAATELDPSGPGHGDMSSMLYLRDHVQAASALMDLNLRDPVSYEREGETGRELLISALHLMSTPAQLARFEDVIKRKDGASQADWPHISLHFDDLEATGSNGWRNKQDTFQMLAYLTLDAVDKGFLNADELNEAHKEFLGSVVPFLAAVGFPKYENSGSWEEIAADRTSVMAVETALLRKIKTLVEKDGTLGFLQAGYQKAKPHFPANDRDFTETLDSMLNDGLHEIGRRIPYESPDYNSDSVKFRKTDAALTYVLMYDLPRLLADVEVPIGPDAKKMSSREIENLILRQLSSLIDPVTNGIARYEEDSYQRVNFHTNEVQWIIGAIKRKVQYDVERRGGEIDLDEKQRLRGELTPPGRTAAWTHPLGQLSAWAANRSIESSRENNPNDAEEYRELSTYFLNRALSTITGEGQWHAVLNESGRYHVRQVPAYRLPECYVTYELAAGEAFVVPSPHTPLNWSSAMVKQAIGLLRVSTANSTDVKIAA